MNLHEHLRELVTYQGPSVVDTAETFRAALDDFLTEDEATTGELNLLVDAVRLGAVVRLRSIMDHGGTPQAAVEEAGDAFARDRGTDDLPRCRWAVAVVGYALGLLEAADVPPTGPQSIPSATQRPAPTPPPYAPTVPPPAAPPSERPPPPPAPSTENTPRTFPSTEDLAPGPVPVTPGPRRRSRGRVALVGMLVAAIVAAAVGVGIWLGSRDDDPNDAADDNVSEPTGGDGTSGNDTGDTGGPEGGVIPEESVLVSVTDEADVTKIYAINVDTGDATPLTEGPADRNPAISPDRSTMIYVEATAGGSTKPMVMDLETGKVRPLFRDDGVCDFAARPAFNPDGKRLAVLCADEFGGYAGQAISNLRGQYEASLPVAGEPNGSPTWTSGSTLVYVQAGFPEDQPTTLWETEVNGLSAPVPLTDGSEGWDTHADWSDEAGLLLYSRHEGRSPFGELLTRDADGNPGPSAEGVLWGHPAWSPDGTSVVFTIRNEDGTEQLATASIDGDGFTDPELLDVPGEPGIPAWGTR